MEQLGQTCKELHYKFLKIVRNKQSSFRIKFNGKVIYIDPIQISEENHDADFVFITHEHSDHFDQKSIVKIINPQTIIICNQIVAKIILDESIQDPHYLQILSPGQTKIINEHISIETKPAYNLNKFKETGILYHPKENNGLGFIITISLNEDKVKIYHMGDTDFIAKDQKIEKVDILMIPVGGTYVMTWQEAVTANNEIKPLVSIPMHFDLGAGIIEDASNFVNEIENQGEII